MDEEIRVLSREAKWTEGLLLHQAIPTRCGGGSEGVGLEGRITGFRCADGDRAMNGIDGGP